MGVTWLASAPWRQRRVQVLAAVLLLSLLWAAGSDRVGGSLTRALRVVPTTVPGAIKAARPTGYPVGGIDISSHDHTVYTVRWAIELAADSRFVYIKATEGTTYVNPHFAADYAAARAVDRYVGAYVFARPDRGDPVGQADFFLRHAKFTKDSRTLVPFIDLESPYASIRANRCYNLTVPQMRAWIRAFADRIEAGIGRKPMIYTSASWWNPCTGNDPSFGRYPLDVAHYAQRSPPLPAGWTTFALWQYAPGDPKKPDSHDRDVVNGGAAGLRALAWPPR